MVVDVIDMILGIIVRELLILNKSIEDWMEICCRWYTTDNNENNCPLFDSRNMPIKKKKKYILDTSKTKQPTEEA